jgi:hypothetical protein
MAADNGNGGTGTTVTRKDFSTGASTASDGAGNFMAGSAVGDNALSSMEQFVTAVHIDKDKMPQSPTPGFRPPSVEQEEGAFADGAMGPTIMELDPYFPSFDTAFMEENDYRLVANNTVFDDGDFNLRKLEDAEDPSLSAANRRTQARRKIKWVRPMNALRGPIIISGWGFGMDDLPVPQKGADWPENNEFDTNTASDRAVWKTGPVHLMWDDERQVWQGGYQIVCGYVVGEIKAAANVCSPTTFKVNVLRNTNASGSLGERRHAGPDGMGDGNNNLGDDINPQEQITVQNRDSSLEQDEMENAIFCIAIKLNYEWIPLWVGCPDDPACDAGFNRTPGCITKATC